MKKLLNVCIFLLLLGSGAYSQNDFRYYEENTLKFYNLQQWDSLIYYGSEALQAGHDYYYLQYRLGVAFFEKADYVSSARQLEKAFSSNPEDHYLRTLLFFSYVRSGRNGDAQYISNFRNSFGDSIAPKPFPFFTEISLDAGYTFSNINDRLSKTELVNNDRIHGISYLPGDNSFSQIGMLHHIGRRIQLFHSYTGLSLQKQLAEAFPGIDTSAEYQSVQHQYYVMLRYRISRGLFFSPSFHWVYNTSGSPYFYEYNFINPSVKKGELDTAFTNFRAGGKLSWFVNRFQFDLEGGISDFNNRKQWQANASFDWRPKNLKSLRMHLGVIVLKDKGLFNPLLDLSFNYRLFEKSQITAFGLIGNYAHSTLYNGYLVFNLYEKAHQRIGLEWKYDFNKHFDFRISYIYANKSALYYFENSNFMTLVDYMNYQTHTITGGIIWKLY